MRLLKVGPIFLLLAGCSVPPDTRAAPTEVEFRALIALGAGSNIAVTSDSAEDPRLRTRLVRASVGETRDRLLRSVAGMPRWAIADSSGSVLWFTRTTRLFRFVDDLFVLVEPRGDRSAVLVRSASRVGKSDLGQNRRNIAELWRALGAPPAVQPLSISPDSQVPK